MADAINYYTGVEFTVYSNIITQYGKDMIRTPVTKTTSNIEGDETLTDGTAETIRAYISFPQAPWFLDKAGLIKGGDAKLLVKATQTINKDDKITSNSINYRVQDVVSRDQFGGVTAFKSCSLFRI